MTLEEMIADLSRRPSRDQYAILEEENRLLREEVLRLKDALTNADPDGSFW